MLGYLPRMIYSAYKYAERSGAIKPAPVEEIKLDRSEAVGIAIFVLMLAIGMGGIGMVIYTLAQQPF